MWSHDQPRDLKPSAWPIAIPDLRPEQQRLWVDCQIAMPFWSIGQGHVEDMSHNRFHGALGAGIAPATDWVGSPWGAALKWTGQSTDKVTVADPAYNALDGFSEFSFEITFLSTTIGASGTLFGLAGKYRPATGVRSWRFYIDGAQLALQTSNDGAGNEIQLTTNAALAANTWYQAVVAFKSGVWTCRLNGSLLTTDGNFSTHTTIFGGTEELKLGQRTTAGSGSDTPLVGQIASFRLFTRALLDAETLLLWDDKWGMYDGGLGLPSLAVEHSGGAAAGPWSEAGVVVKGVQSLLISGLMNATSYDVRIKTRDTTGNTSAGNTPAASTPTAGSSRAPPLRTGPQYSPEPGGFL